MKKIWLIVSAVILITLVAVFWYHFNNKKTNQVACTQEAKLCSNGSSVGRSGPNCEFAACPLFSPSPTPSQINPAPIDQKSWKNIEDKNQGITYSYPETLPTEYIRAQEWPPKITISNVSFSCEETSPYSSLPNRIFSETISDQKYCVKAQDGGAASSIYTEYTYSTTKNEKLIELNFTLQYPQCLNYDQASQTKCQSERETFNLDELINKITQSINFNS